MKYSKGQYLRQRDLISEGPLNHHAGPVAPASSRVAIAFLGQVRLADCGVEGELRIALSLTVAGSAKSYSNLAGLM